MFHRVDGTGEPLLLLNGIAMSVASWEAMEQPLAERFRVVRFDFRGRPRFSALSQPYRSGATGERRTGLSSLDIGSEPTTEE